MAGPALIISIVGDARKLTESLGQADAKVSGFGKSLDLGVLAKGAAVAGVVGIAANALWDMGKAAGEDRAEAAKLTQVIASLGAETSTTNAQVEAAIVAGQNRAFTDTQTREALTSLVTATKDVTSATSLLSVAQDVARFANVDLATAADAVAKAQAGQDMALKKMLPGLQAGKTATDTIANASKIAAGQADLYANSTEGQMARSSDAFAELGETIGSAVLPIMDALLPALIPIIQALGKLVQAILPAIIPLFKLLGQALALVAKAVTDVVNLVADLIAQFLRGIGVVQRFVDSLPDFPSIQIPGLSAATPTGLGVGARSAGVGGRSTGGGHGGVQVNIYGGDPTRVEAAVARALRGYTRRNGALGLAGLPGR
jgi:hypothetical protein